MSEVSGSDGGTVWQGTVVYHQASAERNVFKEGELEEISVRAKYTHSAADGKEYLMQFYNLDEIISVGYRVNSKQGTHFRQWATQVLRDHIVKRYTVNEQRLREESAKLQAIPCWH